MTLLKFETKCENAVLYIRAKRIYTPSMCCYIIIKIWRRFYAPPGISVVFSFVEK